MKNKFLFLIIFSFTFFSFTAKAEKLVVVVHESNKEKNIDKELVRRIFLRQTLLWESGNKTKPVDYNESSELREVFCTKVLEMSCSKYDARMIKVIYQSASNRVKKVKNKTSVLVSVSLEKGGIGYVKESELKKGLRPVLRISY